MARPPSTATPTPRIHFGVLYAEGRGVPRDYVRAYAWFSLAMLASDPRAEVNRTSAVRSMTPAEIAAAEKLAQKAKPGT